MISASNKTQTKHSISRFFTTIILFFSAITCQTLFAPINNTNKWYHFMGCRTYHRPSAVAGYAGDIYFPKYCTASQEEFPAIFAAFLAEEGCSNSKEKWNESLQFLEIDDTNWKKVNPHIISLITLMAAYGTCKCRSENDLKQCRKTVKEIVVQLMSGHPYFIDHPSDPTISNIELIGFLAKYWGVFITEEGMKNIETYSFKD